MIERLAKRLPVDMMLRVRTTYFKNSQQMSEVLSRSSKLFSFTSSLKIFKSLGAIVLRDSRHKISENHDYFDAIPYAEQSSAPQQAEADRGSRAET